MDKIPVPEDIKSAAEKYVKAIKSIAPIEEHDEKNAFNWYVEGRLDERNQSLPDDIQRDAERYRESRKEIEAISAAKKLMVEKGIINEDGQISPYQKELLEKAKKWDAHIAANQSLPVQYDEKAVEESAKLKYLEPLDGNTKDTILQINCRGAYKTGAKEWASKQQPTTGYSENSIEELVKYMQKYDWGHRDPIGAIREWAAQYKSQPVVPVLKWKKIDADNLPVGEVIASDDMKVIYNGWINTVDVRTKDVYINAYDGEKSARSSHIVTHYITLQNLLNIPAEP